MDQVPGFPQGRGPFRIPLQALPGACAGTPDADRRVREGAVQYLQASRRKIISDICQTGVCQDDWHTPFFIPPAAVFRPPDEGIAA